ncbi:DUF3237 domain-containing protein [Congregibacter brevis]|uniref:UPF0311 protein R0137_00395 n=1 Tax=Congregibacter brevis TaxID=3081201 RepID=A0ABZ0IC02_9GAMM|nr:DUF3237 domain-containing protein [Congregibacter sp. IMCC45268]
MQLIHEFTIRANLYEPNPVGAGPIGTRMHYGIAKGTVEGERLNGEVLSGGEWALIDAQGCLRVDVRMQVKTHDDAHIYVQYVGLLGLNETVQNALANGLGTEFEDQHFYVNPRLETGDERYAWVNSTFFVGEGRLRPNAGVEYRVWRPA